MTSERSKRRDFLSLIFIWFFLNEKRKAILGDKMISGHMDKDNENLSYYRVFEKLGSNLDWSS